MSEPSTQSVIESTSGGDLCPHFGDCGGCQSQDVPYAEQLRLKEAALVKLFGPFWEGPIPVTPSPVIWNYRRHRREDAER